MTKKLIWQRPSLRTDEVNHTERKATWLELFYDLVFVVVVAELSHRLEANISWKGVADFAFLFIPVWWVWMVSTLYNDRFETDDLSQRFFTFLQMVPLIGLALTIGEGLEKMSTGFALSYVAARAIILVMWLRVSWSDQRARQLATRFIIGFSISLFFWIVSVFVDPPLRFFCWTIGLIVDLITPFTIIKIQSELPRLTTSHLPERLGLFMIIILGESVTGVVRGAAESQHSIFQTGIATACGLALAFCLGWIYFDNIEHRSSGENLKGQHRDNSFWLIARGYMHLPLVIGLAAIGAGLSGLLAHQENILITPVIWLISGALSLSILSLGLLELTLDREHYENVNRLSRQILRFSGATAALIIGFLSNSIDPFILLMLFVLIAISQIFPFKKESQD